MDPVSTLWWGDRDLGKAWWWSSKGPVLRPRVPASGKSPAPSLLGSRWGGGGGWGVLPALRPPAPQGVSQQRTVWSKDASPPPLIRDAVSHDSVVGEVESDLTREGALFSSGQNDGL